MQLRNVAGGGRGLGRRRARCAAPQGRAHTSTTYRPADPSPRVDGGTLSVATERRRDLQGVRALAVLLVALNHAGVPFLPGGYIGVDVFFVLSGYFITGLLLREALGGVHGRD